MHVKPPLVVAVYRFATARGTPLEVYAARDQQEHIGSIEINKALPGRWYRTIVRRGETWERPGDANIPVE